MNQHQHRLLYRRLFKSRHQHLVLVELLITPIVRKLELQVPLHFTWAKPDTVLALTATATVLPASSFP